MLRLVRLEEKYRPQLTEMMEEWSAAGEKIIPYAIRKNDWRDFAYYLEHLDEHGAGNVPSTTYFCLDDGRDIFVGAVSIRHYLNESLLQTGGHIGDGVRPSERGRGIGTKMIALALEKCRAMGIGRVLMTCDKSNPASARTIEKNGGVLENEIPDGDETVCRYWIDLRGEKSEPETLRHMTSVYLCRGEQLLLLYRQGSRVVNNLWIGSAGGHFEPEELNDARACVLREMKEELNLGEDQIENLRLRYITLRAVKGEIRYNHYFFADLKDGVDVPLHSSEGILRWFSREELRGLVMPHSARYMMDHWLEKGYATDALYGGISGSDGVVFTEMTAQ